jgi:acyl-CoA reductase-like NAD-dependent aldehyde dehydrogenase
MAVSQHFGHFVGGKELVSDPGSRRTLFDPATNEPLATVASATLDEARQAMESAESAFRNAPWATDDGSRRSRALYRLARLLEEQAEEFAALETRNMGKTLKESRGDVAYTVRTLEYVAGLADKIEGETIPVPGARFDYTVREPLGVTVHLAPWNYPLLLAMRSVAPALAAGNAVVLKPASLTPLTALKIASLASKAGVPDGILNVVAGEGPRIGEALITDPRCRSVSFTGSLEVGHRIAELAARRVIPVTLELGGKSPVLVFPDADLDRAARGIAFGIFGNSGQMCWAGSRLIVARSVHDALVSKVQKLAEALKIGPGWEEATDMGPLVSHDQLERVTDYVTTARGDGAHLVTGDRSAHTGMPEKGNFHPPTVLTDVDPDSRIFQEEVFGPVLSVTAFDAKDDAVRLANHSRYGLFAAVWTKDLTTAHTVARQLEAGIVSVNESPVSFPQTPFGGFKESGLGREGGRHGLREYTEVKSISINIG